MDQLVNILCIKWGTRYPAPYVNFLYAGVRRHLKRPFRFVCCTDDARGLTAGIDTIPFPVNPGIKRGWPDVLVKLMVTQDGFGNLRGPTLFLDLDVAIMADIGCFFDFEPGMNCIIHNWVNPRKQLIGRRPPVGNSSIFRFEAGKSNYIYETFLSEMAQAEDLSVWNTEQAFLTHAMRMVRWWPEEWARSYKRHCRPAFPLNLICTPKPPRDCRILVFHGRPDPDEAIRGYQGEKLRHNIKPAPWIAEHWKI
ncbi:MAG: hypothetical protein AAB370_02815 [Verrucomicrobiota bacterium]